MERSKLAKKILRIISPQKDDISLSGDFEEIYNQIIKTDGRFKACLWLWGQALKSLPGFLSFSFSWRFGMIKNYIKIALRNISGHKALSFINIFGLAVGLTCTIWIYLFIADELSYDRFHKNADSIYSVLNIDNYFNYNYRNIPNGMGPALKEYFPEIEYSVRITRHPAVVRYRDKIFEEGPSFADPDFFKMFSFKLLEGNKETVLSSENAVVLRKSAAAKYFGEENPMGKTLEFSFGQRKKEFLVTGVLEDIPSNSTIQFDILLNIKSYEFVRGQESLKSWTWPRNHTYIQLKKGARPEDIEKRLPGLVKLCFAEVEAERRSRGSWLEDRETIIFWLQNLKDIYLHSQEVSGARGSDIQKSIILGGIGLLVLIIGCINFTNLSIGRASTRAVEIGMRKVMGAGRKNLIRQFWSESFLTVFISMITGLSLSIILMPLFNNLANKSLSINDFFTPVNLFVFILIAVIVGFTAGIYPGIVLSGFQPVEFLKGRQRFGGKNLLTKTLITFQFAVSIFLIISTLTMGKQIKFINNKDLGFNKENIVMIRTQETQIQDSERVVKFFKNKADSYEEIISVSGCCHSFSIHYGEGTIEINGITKRFLFSRVYNDYVRTMGMKLVDGRDFSEQFSSENAIVVNREFVKQFNIKNPVGSMADDSEIIGVVDDYNYMNLRHEIEPVIHFIDSRYGLLNILIRISPVNISQTLSLLEKLWKEVQPDKPFTYSFFDEDLALKYNEENRWNSIVFYSSILAIFITCMGLIGITAITISRRIKEIGIRKVLGASVSQVTGLIMKDFFYLVLLANFFIWPVSFYFMNKWLEGFAYRTNISIGTFLFAGILAMIISLITISIQVVKAAVTNPVKSLKYE